MLELLEWSPVVAIVGARQVGKSTLAKFLVEKLGGVYLDLEDPGSIIRLEDPLHLFKQNKNAVICLDEIQNSPNLFVHIKTWVDQHAKSGQFLVLGSASPALLKQSAESLAGRIIYQELGPLNGLEVSDIEKLWLRGGFPRSFLAPNDEVSYTWRTSFIKTFLERDVLQLRQGISTARMRILWNMLAHLNGQILNQSTISRSMDISGTSVSNYIGLLEDSFMVERIPPYVRNTGKRLVKSPKLYFADTGLLHNMLGISSIDNLHTHPAKGNSYESLVLRNIRTGLPDYRTSFYRTAKGAELDFVLEKDGQIIAVEVKSSSTPHLTKGFWNAVDDVQPAQVWIIAPVEKTYSIKSNIIIGNIRHFLSNFR